MRHIEWEKIRPLDDPFSHEIQLVYNDAYRMALEEVLSGVNDLRKSWKGQAFNPYVQALNDVKANVLNVLESVAAARDRLTISENPAAVEPVNSSINGDS